MTVSIKRQANPLLAGAFPLLVIFVFFIFSAVMELIPLLPKMRPQLILGGLGLLAVFGTGQFVRVLSTPIGRSIAIFTAWFIACIPFGAWPGGSFTVLSEVWYKSALTYLLTAGLVTTLPQANRLYHTIAYGVGILGTLALLKNDRLPDGRLGLFNTRYQNSNELAWTLLVGLAFVGFLYLQGTRVQKVIAALAALPILLAMSRTGSRAAMLGTGILVVVVLKQAKRATRNKLMVGLPIVLLAVLILLPSGLRTRFTTLFGSYDFEKSKTDTSERLRVEAIGSFEARKQLLIDSIKVTMRHPLLGVGPGNFSVAQDELAQAGGERSSWQVTHNTYTQLSSEMGVPGLIMFLVLLFNVFKVLNSIIQTRHSGQTWQNLRLLALTLRAALIVFLPVAFFDSLAYSTEVPILAGLATVLGFLAKKQRAIDRANAAPVISAVSASDASLEPATVGQY